MKKLFALLFMLWLVLPSAQACSVSSTRLILTQSTSLESAVVSIVPSLAAANMGGNATVAITVDNVADLFTWQTVLKFNGTILNCTGIWVPEDNIFAGHLANYGAPTFGTDVKDGLTYVLFGYTLLDNDQVDRTSGTLCKANFTVKTVGISPILIATKDKPAQFGDQPWETWQSYLLDSSLNQMPYVEENGAVAAGGTPTFLTITSTDGGTTDPAPSVYAYLSNTSVSVTAAPERVHGRFELRHWELDGVNAGSENPFTATMDANHTLRAVFINLGPVTWTVDKNGPADFHAIHEAFDSSDVVEGDRILVKSGVYYEHVSMTKKLTLIGEDRDTTIIDGNGTGTVALPNGTISGFTIRNGKYGVQIGTLTVTPDFTGCTIENNRIVNNIDGGILLEGCTNNTVSNNVVENNTLFGIDLWGAVNNTVTSNTVANNGHGVVFYGRSEGNVLRNNDIHDSEYNFGVILRGETLMWMFPYGQGELINDVDASNTVNGKPVYYRVNQTGVQVPSEAGYILLIDCKDVEINGCNLLNNLQGVLLINTENVVISDCNVTSNVYGIYTLFSSNTTLTSNVLRGNLGGVYLGPLSRLTTMRNNDISSGKMNFGLDMSIPYLQNQSDLVNDVDASNLVDGKPIIYWIEQHTRQVPTNAGYVMLINSTDITIEDLNLSSNIQNIFILASNNTVIANCSVASSIYGVDVRGLASWPDVFGPPVFSPSFNTTIAESVFTDNGVGLRLDSDNSTLSNNTFYRNLLGMCLTKTSYSTISRNVVARSEYQETNTDPAFYIFSYPELPWERSIELVQLEVGGIYAGGSYNTIYGNTVEDSVTGIVMNDFVRSYYGNGNVIYHNNFINDTDFPAVESMMGSNKWDNGYPSGGNYWSNYAGEDLRSGLNQDEPESDGIIDAEFNIPSPPSRNKLLDRYPLMAPINVFRLMTSERNASLELISNSTVSEIQLREAEKIISFNVTGTEGTSGFCKVALPNSIVEDLWHGNYSVLINGQPVQFENWTDNTDTYVYFTYQHSKRQVTIVPEFPPVAILLSIVLVTTMAAIIIKRRQNRNACLRAFDEVSASPSSAGKSLFSC